MTLFAEPKRRNEFRVAIAYTIASWVGARGQFTYLSTSPGWGYASSELSPELPTFLAILEMAQRGVVWLTSTETADDFYVQRTPAQDKPRATNGAVAR